jgi:hypothetical protein
MRACPAASLPPELVGLLHLVVDRDRRPTLGDELGAHGRLVPVERLLAVDDLLAAVGLDLADVRALQEVGEELRELLPLLRRPRLPVPGERALAGLLPVEHVVRDGADLLAPLLRLPGLFQGGVLENRQHLVDPALELLGRRAGLRRAPRDERQRDDDNGHHEPSHAMDPPDAVSHGLGGASRWTSGTS